jgi:hypothetical protein
LQVERAIEQRARGGEGPVAAELRGCVMKGRPIPTALLTEFVLESIKAGRSLLIQDFPKNEEQASELAKLTNPELFPAETQFQKRCQSLVKVVDY